MIDKSVIYQKAVLRGKRQYISEKKDGVFIEKSL